MFKFKVIALLLFISSFTPQAIAQGNIKGKIELSSTEFPSVQLYTAADSLLVKSVFCDSTGNFDFIAVNPNEYFIHIQFPSFEVYQSANIQVTSEEITLPTIQLVPSVQVLDEVTIQRQKPFAERKADRVLLHPEALIGNTGSALELIEKAPGVLVDENGNIFLKGRQGVLVYIDDKPTYLSNEDITGYLRSIPATSVAVVEIMSNPPAKYDASGNAGIINIVLKKLKTKGLNAGVTLSYGQGRYFRTNNSFTFNYRINTFNFFSTIGITQNNSYQDLTIQRYYYDSLNNLTSAFKQRSYIKRQIGGNTLRMGMDWYLSKKSTIGIVFSGFFNPTQTSVDNTAQIQNSQQQTLANVKALTTSKNLWLNGGLNLNYVLKIDSTGKTLAFNADGLNYSSQQSQQLVNRVYDLNQALLDSLLLDSDLPATIGIITAKMDYTHPLRNNNRFDVGVKNAMVSTTNSALFYDVINEQKSPNYTFTNQFEYKENNRAAYVNYSQDWNKFSLQAGLRFESIIMKGFQYGNPTQTDSSFTRQYNSLFPTFFLSYVPDSAKNHQFGCSIGRRIDYPNYQDMNPFTYPLDGYTYYAGNPFLQPTFSYTAELSHTFKNRFTTIIDYSFVTNLIQETNEQVNGIFYSRPGNFGQQQTYGIGFSGEFKITSWLNALYYTECKNISYNTSIYNQPLVENKWYWYVGPTLRFMASKQLNFELAGTYQTRVLVGQFLTIPVGSIRAGMAYKCFKENGSLKLNVSDLFYTNQPGGDIRNIKQSSASWISLLDTRVVTITFSYRINKGKGIAARQVGAADDEKKRVRTN